MKVNLTSFINQRDNSINWREDEIPNSYKELSWEPTQEINSEENCEIAILKLLVHDISNVDYISKRQNCICIEVLESWNKNVSWKQKLSNLKFQYDPYIYKLVLILGSTPLHHSKSSGGGAAGCATF